MAYTNLTTAGRRRLSGSAKINLNIETNDGDYLCESSKLYTEKSSITQDLDNSDAFITLSSFDKGLNALTVQSAKVVVLKNVSNICQEIMISIWDWRNDSHTSGTTMDLHNAIDINAEDVGAGATAVRTISMILPAGEFIYLPNNRMLSYALLDTTLESAAKAAAGAISIEPKDINSGNEYIDLHLFAGSTYNSGADVQVNEPSGLGITDTTITVDDGDFFEAGDLIMLGSEVISVVSKTANELTVTRGLLGSTAAAIVDNEDLKFFFGNEYLKYDVGRCMTDANGNFSQRGAFFSYARTSGATGNTADGIVAGSVAIGPFYSGGGYLDWGLTGIKASDSTGLNSSTQYTFTVVVDDYQAGGWSATGAAQTIAFTTDANDVSFSGSGNAVLPKIQAIFDEKFYDVSSGLYNKKVTIGLVNGDVRITSHSNHTGTVVGLGNTTGTTPFGVGRFPSKDGSSIPILKGTPTGPAPLNDAAHVIVYGPKSYLEPETIVDPITGKEKQNLSAFILDDGNGNLVHDGAIVGSISYVTGHTKFSSNYAYAEFKIHAESLSAHSGGAKYSTSAYNTITKISARSMNPKADSKIEMLLLG
tara:strand:+ start:3007 stop:4779 length:1773 start_codon:yes stop_codon:yes gene_type:complete